MNTDKYLELMKNIQNTLLDFLDNEENSDFSYQNLIKIFDEHKIKENKDLIKSIIRLLSTIASNYHRSTNFFSKIEKIIIFFIEEIKQTYLNDEIFREFGDCKIILLFLIEQKVITVDNNITEICKHNYYSLKYSDFFNPEIQQYFNRMTKPQITDSFKEKRINGVNDNYICELIRNDSIDEFIIYINKNDIPLNSNIKQSIFESNAILCKNELSLIEYAAFYGSIQIFQYLQRNEAKLNPSLWLYSIHSRNGEIIQFLVDNDIKPPGDSYEQCLSEAIKCHHNEIVDYINTICLDKNDKSSSLIMKLALKYNNYAYIQNDLIKDYMIELIKNNYNICVEDLINNKVIDVNHKFVIKKK